MDSERVDVEHVSEAGSCIDADACVVDEGVELVAAAAPGDDFGGDSDRAIRGHIEHDYLDTLLPPRMGLPQPSSRGDSAIRIAGPEVHERVILLFEDRQHDGEPDALVRSGDENPTHILS
jgi:hypothetical protein